MKDLFSHAEENYQRIWSFPHLWTHHFKIKKTMEMNYVFDIILLSDKFFPDLINIEICSAWGKNN